jgi:peptide/nickel transport system ATP-binding protein
MSQQVGMETDSTDRDALVQVRNLKTYYGGDGLFSGQPVRAVDGVTFNIQEGETLGLVGESGCGKSTLGRTLLQLEDATGGEILYDGEDITSYERDELLGWRRNAQMVFQDPESSMNERMTVGEIVREPLDVHEWKTDSERRQRVQSLLETVGLQREHYYRYPHQFSGGQRQRISIARTLSLNPDFMVLDEPVSALDVSVQAEIINLLEDLQDEFGLTYLFIAHDLSVVRHISDRVAVMYLGHIMEIGPTEELFTDPSNPYTHALLSAIPHPDPDQNRERITLQGTPPNPRYPPDGCPFSTRCPARIRPPEYEDLDEEIWSELNTVREVLRERQRAERTVRERIRERLGWETRFGDMNDTMTELFGDRDVPADLQEILDEIARRTNEDNEEAALELLNDEFGSVCDGISEESGQSEVEPEFYTMGAADRKSYCHRHDSEYREPGPVIEERSLKERSE